jgi:hypothetical protein
VRDPTRHCARGRRAARRAATLIAAAAATLSFAAPAQAAGPTGELSAFNGNGMWIWYLSKANGGDLDSIANRAQNHDVGTVFIKSGDGPNYWSQFSSSVVSGLQSRGLNVCAWQFMYGDHARQEADTAWQAIQKGAECFVMDPESAFEGRYKQADRYIHRLRNHIGNDTYPIGLASFPYVQFHPALPYSVFLRPGDGAQRNLPQMYWKAIGDTPEEAYSTTYRYNRPYDRGIRPLGQTFDNPSHTEVKQFRRWALEYGANGLSWWSWQHTNSTEWDWVGESVSPFDNRSPDESYAVIKKGSQGDLVIWAKEHLVGAGYDLKVSGNFGNKTDAAVRDFQSHHGLDPDGSIGKGTWLALNEVAPCNWRWGIEEPHCQGASTSTASVSSTGGVGPENPDTASLPAVRYEIPPASARR